VAPSQEHHPAPWWCQRLSSIFSTLGVQQVGRMPVGRTFLQGLQSIFPLSRKQGPPVPQQYSGPCPVPIDAMRTGSLSQGSKVMNADFYRDIRAQTAVCPVNAVLEGRRHRPGHRRPFARKHTVVVNPRSLRQKATSDSYVVG
jgi:hypothetical protein